MEIRNLQQGFTLLEIIVAMAIITFLFFGFTAFIGVVQESSRQFTNSLTTQQQIQNTLQLMIPEIRSAAQSNTGAYPLGQVASTSLQFYSDIDADGLYESVHYYRDGDVFKKGVIKPGGSPLVYATSSLVVYDLVENMVTTAPVFAYYGASATSTDSVPLSFPVNVLDVKTVQIMLTANQGTDERPSIVGVSDRVTIRNLRYK